MSQNLLFAADVIGALRVNGIIILHVQLPSGGYTGLDVSFDLNSYLFPYFGLILHTPGPEIRQHVAYIYIDTPCAYPPSYPSIRYA